MKRRDFFRGLAGVGAVSVVDPEMLIPQDIFESEDLVAPASGSEFLAKYSHRTYATGMAMTAETFRAELAANLNDVFSDVFDGDEWKKVYDNLG